MADVTPPVAEPTTLSRREAAIIDIYERSTYSVVNIFDITLQVLPRHHTCAYNLIAMKCSRGNRLPLSYAIHMLECLLTGLAAADFFNALMQQECLQVAPRTHECHDLAHMWNDHPCLNLDCDVNRLG